MTQPENRPLPDLAPELRRKSQAALNHFLNAYAESANQDASATAVQECRLYFLRAAVKHPDIRLGDSLRERVFEPSEQFWVKLGLPAWPHALEKWMPEQHAALLPRFVAERARLIKEWAAGHNLGYEWVYAEAERTFLPGMFPTSLFALVPADGALRFHLPPWRIGESEEEYRKHLDATFQRQSDQFIQAVKLERSRFLNHRDSFSQMSRYSWAAEHVCLKQRFSVIARRARPERTEQGVRKAVVLILERIGIPSHYNLQKAQKGIR